MFKSLISPITEFISLSKSNNSYKLGLDGGFNEYPVTLAPYLTKILVNHEPLKPVCPVSKIFLFLKNYP